MGTIFLDGVQIGDDGRNARSRTDLPWTEWAKQAEAEREARRAAEKAAHESIYADVEARARASVKPAETSDRSSVNKRARFYRGFPRELEKIERGLSQLPAGRMILRAEAALERASRPFGAVQIVPVRLINARAALLLARWERRFGERSTVAANMLQAAE